MKDYEWHDISYLENKSKFIIFHDDFAILYKIWGKNRKPRFDESSLCLNVDDFHSKGILLLYKWINLLYQIQFPFPWCLMTNILFLAFLFEHAFLFERLHVSHWQWNQIYLFYKRPASSWKFLCNINLFKQFK